MITDEWESSRCFQSSLRQENTSGQKSSIVALDPGETPDSEALSHLNSLNDPFSASNGGTIIWKKKKSVEKNIA